MLNISDVKILIDDQIANGFIPSCERRKSINRFIKTYYDVLSDLGESKLKMFICKILSYIGIYW